MIRQLDREGSSMRADGMGSGGRRLMSGYAAPARPTRLISMTGCAPLRHKVGCANNNPRHKTAAPPGLLHRLPTNSQSAPSGTPLQPEQRRRQQTHPPTHGEPTAHMAEACVADTRRGEERRDIRRTKVCGPLRNRLRRQGMENVRIYRVRRTAR